MNITIKHLTSLAAVICLTASASLWAVGDRNAVNSPLGSPDDDTFDAPYVNPEGGRVLVFCEDGEKLVVTPVGGGVIDVICVPAEE